MDATILMMMFAVCLTTENSLGIVVLRASLKSLLFRKCSIGGLVVLQPLLDQRRQVVGVGGLVHPAGQDFP